MKILIVNTLDIQGGAARAAYRLHQSLLAENIDSQMLVQSNSSDDFTVLAEASKIRRGFNQLRSTLDSLPIRRYKQRSKTLFSPAWLGFSAIVDKINKLKPEIVHLHWVAGGMMPIEDIARINAPIVWSLHDMWAFTGGCHYDEGCEAFEKACGKCKVLGSDKPHDLSSKVFKKKLATYAEHPNLTVVGLSQWLADCASKSKLFKKRQIVCLPNPIDTSVYSPLDKRTARDLLGLPMDKKLILFGAMNATSDPRKGYGELCEALMQLEGDGLELVVFGGSKPEIQQDFKLKAHYLGQLRDDVTLRALYSAADVMVVPSKQEAFGQTASESMSCGTPVVAFACTGLLDLVEHLKTGYLAKPYNTVDLAAGIEWVLHTPNYQELSINAREKVLNEFDSSVVAKQYIQLYESVLEKQDYD